MTKKRTTFFTFLLTWSFLFSCNGDQTKHNDSDKHETPKALKDEKIELKSYSRSGDLIEELYSELLERSPELKKLEDDIGAFTPKPNELNELFKKYNSKSTSYYSSANYKATAITDSLLKKKILALITTSKNKYANKTAELNSLLKQISQNEATLDDHHFVLKIVLTIPIIENYQTENLPDKKAFNSLIMEPQKLIQQTDSLIPNF